MKSKFKILIFFVVCSLLFVGCSSKTDKLEAVDINDLNQVLFEIPSGSNVTIVANELESMGLINDSKVFKQFASENNLTNIKAGEYMISKSMTSVEILGKFVDGDTFKGTKIVIPEGFEAIQIVDRLVENGIGNKENYLKIISSPSIFSDKYEFLKDKEVISLEGYLYPLTYYFKDTQTEEEVIDQMLKQFQFIYENKIKPYKDEIGMTTNEIVTLASIVEREAAIKEEMPLVASVFENRIKINMPLQSCATVQYILGERKPILSGADIKIDSPYNTYMYSGLPIGAVSSPGENAIISVINPDDTDYLYFLSKNDGSGEQVYSETYEEHLKNKQKYLS